MSIGREGTLAQAKYPCFTQATASKHCKTPATIIAKGFPFQTSGAKKFAFSF